MSVLAALALSSLTVAAPGDAPMTLVTDHGVELQANERVFLLFAALNAAGYAEEPKRKGPPLNAPVFHPIREEVRDALRNDRARNALGDVRAVFEKNPEPIAVYIEAVLGRTEGSPAPRGTAKALADALAPIERFREEATVEAVFDKLVEAQRAHMKELEAALEKDFEQVRAILGDEAFRAPVELVVVPNPLDGHGLVRKLDFDGKTYLVVGPGTEAARRDVLVEALRPSVRAMVQDAYAARGRLADSWNSLKTSKRITSKWADAQAYLTDALTHAVAHRAAATVDGRAGRDADEAFIDAQAKDGMRWARIAMRMLDEHDDGKLSEALPKLVRSASR